MISFGVFSDAFNIFNFNPPCHPSMRCINDAIILGDYQWAKYRIMLHAGGNHMVPSLR